jgi:hypothetical protein
LIASPPLFDEDGFEDGFRLTGISGLTPSSATISCWIGSVVLVKPLY